ncbi:MAG: hypothetical protein P1U46_02550 [Patescibacteria group bacterium]|nr:hypothetical protein [Patescibacteria group bacterium]
MKTFFHFLSFLLVSCIITEIVSNINIAQTMKSIKTVFVSIAIIHKFAQSAKLQTSHI